MLIITVKNTNCIYISTEFALVNSPLTYLLISYKEISHLEILLRRRRRRQQGGNDLHISAKRKIN